jgi:hypothetical protein
MPPCLREAGPHSRRIRVLTLTASPIGCEGIGPAAALEGNFTAPGQSAGAHRRKHDTEKNPGAPSVRSILLHIAILHHPPHRASTPIDVFIVFPTFRSFQ